MTDVCSPHQARLTSDIVSSHLLGVEQVIDSLISEANFCFQARQNKLQKKLDRQVQLGVISPETRTAQLEKLGRRNLKQDENDDGLLKIIKIKIKIIFVKIHFPFSGVTELLGRDSRWTTL